MTAINTNICYISSSFLAFCVIFLQRK